MSKIIKSLKDKIMMFEKFQTITNTYNKLHNTIVINNNDDNLINENKNEIINTKQNNMKKDNNEIYEEIIIKTIIDDMINQTVKKVNQKEYYDTVGKYNKEENYYPIDNINEKFINNLLKNKFKLKYFQEFVEILENIHYGNDTSNFYNIKYIRKNDKNTGVFHTDNFIIKIDKGDDEFISENYVVNKIGGGLHKDYNCVLPFYIKINKKTISKYNYSIQPYIKDAECLHDWLYEKKRFYPYDYDNKELIQICLLICNNLKALHNKKIVHGDIKPDNILIKIKNNELQTYLIDFGLSGPENIMEGTGGTKPFCHPCMNNYKNDNENNYKYSIITRENDIWSLALIFMTLFIFRKLFYYYHKYPNDFFLEDGYINPYYFNYILCFKLKKPFIYALSKDRNESINLNKFIELLEQAL